MPAASCQQKFRRLSFGIEPEGFLSSGVQQELNGLLEVAKAFCLGLALAIRARNFQTRRPITALIGFASVNNSCELFHAPTYNPSCRGIKMVLFRHQATN